MSKNIIRYNNIIKRSRCLNSLSESSSSNSQKIYNDLTTLLEKNDTDNYRFKQLLKSYIENISYGNIANEYYYQPINLCEMINKVDTKVSDSIICEYSNRVLPYIKDLDSVYNVVDRSSLLTESQKDTLLSAININGIADRIMNNHNMISKRYRIEEDVKKYNTLGLKYVVDSCADKLSTYSIKNYQKLNTVIEEVSYLLDKNSIDYDRAEVAKYALEYYLTQSPYISDIDIDNYKRAIESSYILEDSDVSRIEYMNPERKDTGTISNEIDNYIMLKNKDENKLPGTIKSIVVKADLDDIKYNSGKIISLLWDLAKNKVFEDDSKIYESFNIVSELPYNISNINMNICKEDVKDIIDIFEANRTNIYNSGLADIGISKSANSFIKNALDPCIESLHYLENVIYNKDNLEILEFVNNENSEVVALDEFKIFKFHNLVRAAFNLDKFLKIKERKFYNKAKSKVTKFVRKAKNVLFGEMTEIEDNMFDYIGEDCKADICIRQYPFNESEISELSSYLESICSEYNDMLVSQDESCRVYYTINPGLAEVRIKESTAIALDEVDMQDVMNSVDPSVVTYAAMIKESNNICDIYEGITVNTIESTIANMNKCEDFNMERFELALEAMAILGVDKDTVIRFGDKFANYQFAKSLENKSLNESYNNLAKDEKAIAKIVSEYSVLEEVTWEDQIKAYDYLQQIFEYSYPKVDYDDEDDEDDDEDEKEEAVDKKDNKPKEDKKDISKKDDDIKLPPPPEGGYKGSININNIKLGVMGLRTKMKEMSTKEKELSRNMDNASRALLKGIKDSLVSDRREAIIKGSIIPSFSRCIKAAIALAAIGYFSLPAACITAVAGLALSKKLTKQERLLLLDEIETELDVVDKELAIAESNNEINKYRALLQYKKNLQRQYQRIRYNIRVGKDILPGSAAGIPHHD